MRLRITEIFFSLQGETKTVGLPTVFVRLTGCPLRCQYCDTEYAFHGGQWWEFADIMREIKQYQTKYITVTGGEPLAQPNCIPLLKELCDQGYHVSLETSGAMDIAQVDERVMTVMDIKTPASGEEAKNKWENLQYIKADDQLKFVICNAQDYEWSKQKMQEHDLANRCEVLFSPSHAQIKESHLANWIIKDQLPVRFQLQLHKTLWGDVPGV